MAGALPKVMESRGWPAAGLQYFPNGLLSDQPGTFGIPMKETFKKSEYIALMICYVFNFNIKTLSHNLACVMLK